MHVWEHVCIDSYIHMCENVLVQFHIYMCVHVLGSQKKTGVVIS